MSIPTIDYCTAHSDSNILLHSFWEWLWTSTELPSGSSSIENLRERLQRGEREATREKHRWLVVPRPATNDPQERSQVQWTFQSILANPHPPMSDCWQRRPKWRVVVVEELRRRSIDQPSERQPKESSPTTINGAGGTWKHLVTRLHLLLRSIPHHRISRQPDNHLGTSFIVRPSALLLTNDQKTAYEKREDERVT